MLIRFLKTGYYSLHPAKGPALKCAAGETTTIEDSLTSNIIRDGWAQQIIEHPEHGSLKVVTIRDQYPWHKAGWNQEAPDAKLILEKYGKEQLGIDIDRRRTVPHIIEQLKAAAEESK